MANFVTGRCSAELEDLIGGFAAYAPSRGRALVDRELYLRALASPLPIAWVIAESL